MKKILLLLILEILVISCESSQNKNLHEVDTINEKNLKEFINMDLCPNLGLIDPSTMPDKFIKFYRIYDSSSNIDIIDYNYLKSKYKNFRVLKEDINYGANVHRADLLLLDPKEFNFFDALAIDSKENVKNFLINYNFLCAYDKDKKPGFYNKINYVKNLNTKLNFLNNYDSEKIVILESFDYHRFMLANFNSKDNKIENSLDLSRCGIPLSAKNYNYCHHTFKIINEKNEFEIDRILENTKDNEKNKNFIYSISILDHKANGKYNFTTNTYNLDLKDLFPIISGFEKGVIFPEINLKINKESMERIINENNNSIRILFSIDNIKNYKEIKKKCIEGTGGQYCSSLGICEKCFKFETENKIYKRIKLNVKELIIIDKNENILFRY